MDKNEDKLQEKVELENAAKKSENNRYKVEEIEELDNDNDLINTSIILKK